MTRHNQVLFAQRAFRGNGDTRLLKREIKAGNPYVMARLTQLGLEYRDGAIRQVPIDVCAGCGQTILTTPDDPMQALWCDTCEGGVKVTMFDPEAREAYTAAEHARQWTAMHGAGRIVKRQYLDRTALHPGRRVWRYVCPAGHRHETHEDAERCLGRQ